MIISSVVSRTSNFGHHRESFKEIGYSSTFHQSIVLPVLIKLDSTEVPKIHVQLRVLFKEGFPKEVVVLLITFLRKSLLSS